MSLEAIYLDVDGVLADFLGSLLDHMGLPKKLAYEPDNNHFWAIVNIIEEHTGKPCSERDFWAILETAGHSFWETLPKYHWADALYALCCKAAPTIIMTSPGMHHSSASGKMSWITKNIPNARKFAITPCKPELAHAGALLIDDSVEGCEEFVKNGGEAYLFPQPWSRPDWHEVNPLAEIEKLLEKLKASTV